MAQLKKDPITGLTPLQEAFAIEIGKGVPQGDAYIAANPQAKKWKRTTLDSQASRMAKLPAVKARIEKLRAIVVETAENDFGVNRAWVIKLLKDNAEKAAQAVPVLDREGVEIGEYKFDGAVVNKAGELLGKLVGEFVEKKEIKVDLLSGLKPESLAALQTFLEKSFEG